jgi:hypothetical protein
VAQSLLVVDILVGLALVGAIALGAIRRTTSSSRIRTVIGWALVAVPLPLAVALHLIVRPPVAVDQAAFIGGVAAFALGAAFLLAGEDRREPLPATDEPDGPTPWWPEFERDFRAYAKRQSRPRLRR